MSIRKYRRRMKPQPDLYAEHGFLVDLKFDEGLSPYQERRLAWVRGQLDQREADRNARWEKRHGTIESVLTWSEGPYDPASDYAAAIAEVRRLSDQPKQPDPCLVEVGGRWILDPTDTQLKDAWK